MNKIITFIKEHAASIIFWTALCAAIAMGFVGVFTPPPGIIDQSVLKWVQSVLFYGAFGTLAASQIFKH